MSQSVSQSVSQADEKGEEKIQMKSPEFLALQLFERGLGTVSCVSVGSRITYLPAYVRCCSKRKRKKKGKESVLLIEIRPNLHQLAI